MVGGVLADRWGRKPTLLLALWGAAVMMIVLGQVQAPVAIALLGSGGFRRSTDRRGRAPGRGQVTLWLGCLVLSLAAAAMHLAARARRDQRAAELAAESAPAVAPA